MRADSKAYRIVAKTSHQRSKRAAVLRDPARNLLNLVLLKQPDSGDARGARLQTGFCISLGYAPERENGHIVLTGTAQGSQARWAASSFGKHRREHYEIGAVARGHPDFLFGMAGHGHYPASGFSFLFSGSELRHLSSVCD